MRTKAYSVMLMNAFLSSDSRYCGAKGALTGLGDVTKRVSEKSLLPWWEKVRMRGITLVTLTSILSHQGRGGIRNDLFRHPLSGEDF